MDTRALRDEHRTITDAVSRLGGLVHDLRTRGDAHDVRAAILAIDAVLHRHLQFEDRELYPALMAAGDPAIRELGGHARENVGGLIGVWTDYRDRWTVEAILGDRRRFTDATAGVVGALSLRMEMENDQLYPALDALRAPRRSGGV